MLETYYIMLRTTANNVASGIQGVVNSGGVAVLLNLLSSELPTVQELAAMALLGISSTRMMQLLSFIPYVQRLGALLLPRGFMGVYLHKCAQLSTRATQKSVRLCLV